MKSFEHVVKDELGLHARPAGLLVKEAGKYQSKITVSCGAKSAEAKKLLAIMGMGIKCGQTVTVSVEGADESVALEGVKAFFQKNL
jgi:Phosphotransferase System HPr (HPr) Family